MGINIGIIESEAPSAPCKDLRSNIVKVHMKDVSGFEDAAIYDEFVPYEKAKAAVSDWDAFVKRNRLNEEADAVYIEKIKKDDDLALMKPLAERVCTGWVPLADLPDDRKKAAIEKSDDRVTGWDLLDFDEMNGMCGSCPCPGTRGGDASERSDPTTACSRRSPEGTDAPSWPPSPRLWRKGRNSRPRTPSSSSKRWRS